MITQRTTGRRKQVFAAAVVSAALLCTAACGGGGSKDDKSGGAAGYNAGNNKIASPSAKKGGTLKFASVQDTDSWDPTRAYYGVVWDFMRYYTRQLVTNKTEPGKAGSELTPDLATSTAKVSDDGKTYSYTLRDGVTWEDGKPITSEDIKYGIERQWAQDVLSGGPVYLKDVLDPKGAYKGPYKDTSKDGLKAIETPDAKTIVFHLPTANSDFEEMLALTSSSPVRADKDTKSKYGLQPFSSGPYKFAPHGYTPNKGTTLVRNTNWKQSSDPVRKALPDKITMTLFTNADDMDNRLLAGDYDLDFKQTGLSPQGRIKALKEHKGNLDNPTSGYIRYAAFPQIVKPFDNIHCRQAVIYGADHKSIQTARGGPLAGGDIGTNMLPPAVPGAEGQKYDPYGIAGNDGAANIAKAKEELKACGHPEGFKTTIAVRNNTPVEVASAQSLQASLKKIGITAEIDHTTVAVLRRLHRQPDDRQAEELRHHHHGLGPRLPAGPGLRCAAVEQQVHPSQRQQQLRDDQRPEDRRQLRQVHHELDDAKKASIATDINHQVMEGAYYLPFTFEKYINWRSDRLTNVYNSDGYSGSYDFVNLGVVK